MTEREAVVLIERQMVEQRGRGRVTSLVLRNGIAIAAIHAALRLGMRDRLPVAEDSRTVRLVPGLAFTYEPHPKHVRAWYAEYSL